MIRIWIKTTLVLLLLVTLSCEREDSYVSEVNYIAYGTSFGECLGYCMQYMKVYSQIATLRQYGWGESGELPEIQCSLPLESHEFIAIKDSVNAGNFFSLDETYGCPDCADGGAEWVEISFDTLKHRVTFEFLNEPEELTPIVKAMREMMLKFDGCDQ